MKKRERKRERGENGLGYFCFFFLPSSPTRGGQRERGVGGSKEAFLFYFCKWNARSFLLSYVCVCVRERERKRGEAECEMRLRGRGRGEEEKEEGARKGREKKKGPSSYSAARDTKFLRLASAQAEPSFPPLPSALSPPFCSQARASNRNSRFVHLERARKAPPRGLALARETIDIPLLERG